MPFYDHDWQEELFAAELRNARLDEIETQRWQREEAVRQLRESRPPRTPDELWSLLKYLKSVQRATDANRDRDRKQTRDEHPRHEVEFRRCRAKRAAEISDLERELIQTTRGPACVTTPDPLGATKLIPPSDLLHNTTERRNRWKAYSNRKPPSIRMASTACTAMGGKSGAGVSTAGRIGRTARSTTRTGSSACATPTSPTASLSKSSAVISPSRPRSSSLPTPVSKSGTAVSATSLIPTQPSDRSKRPMTTTNRSAIQSKEVDQIFTALVAAQAEMENVAKNATNDYLQSRFADLAAVRGACIGPLNAHGIAVSQQFRPHEGDPLPPFKTTKSRKDRQDNSHDYEVTVSVLGYLRTQLSHTSGQYIASELPLVCNWGDPHALGGIITYLRRYELAAIVGLAQFDDDGESAKERGNHQATASAPRPPTKKPATPSAPPSSSPAPQIAAATPPPPKVETPAPAPAPTPAPAPRAQAPERPKTGSELYKFCVNNRIDPQLKGFVVGCFSQRGYPIMLKEWSDEQVSAAWPTIKDHLQRVKLEIQAAELAGATV